MCDNVCSCCERDICVCKRNKGHLKKQLNSLTRTGRGYHIKNFFFKRFYIARDHYYSEWNKKFYVYFDYESETGNLKEYLKLIEQINKLGYRFIITKHHRKDKDIYTWFRKD